MCLVFLLSRLVSVFWTGDEAIDGLRTQLLERILKACGGDQIHTSTHTVGFIGNGSGEGGACTCSPLWPTSRVQLGMGRRKALASVVHIHDMVHPTKCAEPW